MPHDRRTLLRRAAALAAGAFLSPALTWRAHAQVRFARYPFPLGVASGAPLDRSVVLWTRLAPDPLAGGGMPDEDVAVRWEVAADERFRTVVRSGETRAVAALGHSVHVEATGLAPARWYWYRFLVAGEESPVGRTRTAPAPGANVTRARMAFSSCQQYEQGYYGAYRHMAREELDFVVFLGDYIYESSWGNNLVRRHADPREPVTLIDYRNRHAQYKSDRDLRAMHAACPWFVIWDDHEVENDYADDRSETLAPDFLARRAAAYQAYFEHMPLRRVSTPDGARLQLYARYDYGRLLRLHLLDGRQYRSHQVCPRPNRGGSNFVVPGECPALFDPDRTYLGKAQERWLAEGLTQSPARWNLLAQATLMAKVDADPGAGERYWTDGWDGYAPARARLLDTIDRAKLRNCLVIGGDVHSHWVANLKRDFRDERSATLATEFVASSITSQARAQRDYDSVLPGNPHVLLADGRRRGYVVLEFRASRSTATLRSIESEKRRDTDVFTRARYVVEQDRPGAQRA